MKKNTFQRLVVLFGLVFLLFFANAVFAEEVVADEIVSVDPNEEIIEEDPIPMPINIFIRNGENVIYDGSVDLPEAGTLDILDNSGVSHLVNIQSLLGVLYTLDQANDSFAISNLQYYDSFGSFYLKCITSGEIESCENWQYVVNGVSPWTGIDQTILTGNEEVVLYFGTPHKLTLDKNEILEGESITVNSLKYNYTDNTWEALSGVNISVTVPNESDPWNPTVISETAVDENGLAIITLGIEGTYTFGIKEDYSFPSYQVIVTKPSSTGGGGGGGGSSVPDFSLANAISFLSLNQDTDGSFGQSLYTDWTAVGIAKADGVSSSFKNQIFNYLKNNELESSIVTDNERHAMALMALGIDPYTGTSINYINKIVSSFDGNQIGDSSLYNDDIFALIVLSHAGYTESDQIISKVVSFIISKQSSDGSWGSVDITSASIQALDNFKNIDGVDQAISDGETYLKEEQESDGGFGNSFSTSWAIQAMSLDNSLEAEVDEAIEYLASQQQSDGGVDEGSDIESRIWATSYAIPAVLKLSWNDILESFSKDEEEEIEESNTSSDDEEVEELPDVQDPEVVNLTDEKKPEEIPEIVKKVQVKKENISSKEIETESLVQDETSTNLLSASAVGSDQNPDTFFSIISKVIHRLEKPFLWLWAYLISLI